MSRFTSIILQQKGITLQQFFDRFNVSFQEELLELIDTIKHVNLRPVEALCIYSAGGFRSIGYAVREEGDVAATENFDLNFLAALKGHDDLEAMFSNSVSSESDLSFQICADEWLHINKIDCFSKTNAIVESNLDQLYDAGYEQKVIQTEILNTVITSLAELTSQGMVSPPEFSSDSFFSVQFSGGANSNILFESSKQLNSSHWHKKVERFVKENY
ncbi:hypothetical protein [Shewanella woodyi]|uniref:hypothetical protein n=1 Tax=Shewanella woodyi TaxID=60961 RepID=UPI003748E22A